MGRVHPQRRNPFLCVIRALGIGMLAAVLSGASVAAQDTSTAPAPYQEKLQQAYDLIAQTPFVLKPTEVEQYGENALRLSGDSRIYALWRVLAAYRMNGDEARYKAWHKAIVQQARTQGDAALDLFARFMWQAYQNQVGGFGTLSNREWETYLSTSNHALHNVVALEKMREAQYLGQWPQAIELSEALIVRLKSEGSSAEALLAVAHQMHAYSMIQVSDYDAYADQILAAARLSRNNTFFYQKLDMVRDLTIIAVGSNDIALAQKLQKLYAINVRRYDVADLKVKDKELCAIVAGKAEDYHGIIACLKGTPAEKGIVSTPEDAAQLFWLTYAHAHLYDHERAQSYYALLKALPEDMSLVGETSDLYLQAYLKAGRGDYAAAFRDVDAYARAASQRAEQYRVASVQDMYKALRKELDSRTQESRLLVQQVRMQRLLLMAAAVIGVLLALMVAGGVFWGLRMKRLHRQLNEAHDHAEAANAAKSRFLAVMSHELRTPLNGVLGMAQALKKNELAPSQREQVDILVDSGETLLALLNDVLDMSRIEAGKVELAPVPSSMKDMADRVVNTYSALLGSKDVVLRYELEASATRPMRFDVLRVYQCLSNLVSNAIKFTEQGSVRISVSAKEDVDGGYRVRCEVRDTGIGMSKAVVERLFEAYSQADAMTARKYGGSGLGLSISRRLAELMGGDLTVTSEEGRGSTFVMTFHAGAVEDVAPRAEAPSASLLAEENESLPGQRILLVDDHPVNRKVARLFLEPFGFVITEAVDGKEALDMDMSRFDLVLMDLNMPKMGGLEATRLFRASEAPGRHVPIIALTADAMQDQVEACMAAGMDAHIAKPIIMDTLIETVTRLLRLHDDVDEGATAAVTAI